eukprot:13396963-Ditylum_brightwellii.AAC.1
MPARLNIAASSLATNYSIQHSTQCIEVPRMEINCAQLCTTTGVITSHYSKMIRDIVTTKDLCKHIKEKRGGQIQYLTVLIGQLINVAKIDYITMTPKL